LSATLLNNALSEPGGYVVDLLAAVLQVAPTRILSAPGIWPPLRGHVLTDDDRMRADIIERIMCDFRADIGRICGSYRRYARQCPRLVLSP
jgi:hypothetical protein